MACNGEPMKLACDGGGEEARVAVYSAHFASAAGSHMYCPVPDRGSGIHSDFNEGKLLGRGETCP